MFVITLCNIDMRSSLDKLEKSFEFNLNLLTLLSISNLEGYINISYSVNSRSSKSPQLTVKCLAGISSFGLPTGKFFG